MNATAPHAPPAPDTGKDSKTIAVVHDLADAEATVSALTPGSCEILADRDWAPQALAILNTERTANSLGG